MNTITGTEADDRSGGALPHGAPAASVSKPGATTRITLPRADSLRGGQPIAATPALSPFLAHDSRPTLHEWVGALRDPSHRARYQIADCHCAAMALLDPFHGLFRTLGGQHNHVR